MLGRGHVEVEHRMLCPLFLQFPGLQPLEQFFLPREVTMDRRRQQRLPEPPRPAEKHIFVILTQVVHKPRLVDVEVPTLDNIPECLNPDRISYPFRLHSPYQLIFNPKDNEYFPIHAKSNYD